MSSIVLYGPPGSGKTTMACTMAKLGYQVHIFDADQKASKMENIRPLVDQNKVVIHTMESTLIEGDLKARILQPKVPPRKQPKGYLEFIDFVSNLQKEPPESFKDKVLVVDSTTTLFSHLRRLILHVQGRGAMEIQDWGIILSNLEELFSVLFSLPFEHVILIAHDQTERDELIGKVEIKPLVDGQMKNKVGLYVEEMYYLQPEITKDKSIYRILTKPLGRVTQVRTSRNLDTYEPADFSIIFKEGASK